MTADIPLRRIVLATTLLMLTTLMWAGNAVAARLALGEVSPMMLTHLRWLLAVAVLLPLNIQRLKADRVALRANWPFLLAMGALGYTGFNLLLYSAALTTSAINITIVQAAMPMMIFLINLAVFSVAIGWLQVVGYLVTLAGVVLVASDGDPARLLALDVSPGDMLMLLAGLLYAAYTVGLKRRLTMHPLSLLTAMSIGALITSVPFALAEHWAGMQIVPATGLALGVVVYTALCASVLSQWFYMQGVGVLGANRAGLFINLVPVFGAMLAVGILGERMAPHQAVALALVLGGILIAQRSRAAG